MSFEIKKATRQGIKPLIGIYSESGCGKTMSALLLARGFVGPAGKIGMIDTESGRGELYADVIPGGYDVLRMEGPFSPKRHIEAVTAVEQSGAQIGILDSASHEWEGIGGVLDMAGEEEARMGAKNLGTWRMPKMEHAKFLNRLLQSSIPWIVCLRAKYKTRQVRGTEQMAEAGIIRKNDVGKMVVLKDEATTAIQAEDFIFEMTAHFEILQKHTIIVTKCSHPALRDCFPKDRERPIEIKDGEAIARWCASPGTQAAPASTQSQAPAGTTVKDLKLELWTLLKPHRGTEKSWDVAEGWLLAKTIIGDTDSIGNMDSDQLKEVIVKVKQLLNPEPPPQ